MTVTDRVDAARVAVCTDAHDWSFADDAVTKSVVSEIELLKIKTN